MKMSRGLLLLKVILLTSAMSSILAAPDQMDSFNRYRQKIPRIGRRGDGIISEYMDSDAYPQEGSMSNFFLKSSKAVPRLGRRDKDLTIRNPLMMMRDEGKHPWKNRNDFKLEDIDDGLEMNYWPNFDNSGEEMDAINEDVASSSGGIPKSTSRLNDRNIYELLRKWKLYQYGIPKTD